MLSRFTSRSRSDSRPRPLHIPGRRTRVRSLIEFYNQKALSQVVVTSRPYQDLNKIPSNRVRSLVLSYTNAASAVTSTSNLNSGREDGGLVVRGDMAPYVALRGQVEVSEVNIPSAKTGDVGLRSVRSWKSNRERESTVKTEEDEVVARRSTRRRKKDSRRASQKSPGSSEEVTVVQQKGVQPLTAPRLKALESEVNRSSSLEMEVSASMEDATTDSGPAKTLSSSKLYIEQNTAKDGVKITNPGQRMSVSIAPSIASKRSGTWKEAFQSVRDSFRRKTSVTESTISTKASEESTPSYNSRPLKPIRDNKTPEPPATGYITAPDTFGASKNPVLAIQTQANRLHMLETLASEDDENTLPSDQEQQKIVVDVDKALQEVSGPSLSQIVEDPNTLSGVGELVAWDNSASRRRRSKTFSKRRRSERRPVANAFRTPSPILIRESPLNPVSPLRVIKDKIQTIDADISDSTEIFNPPRGGSGALLNRASIDTLTSFKEPSLPDSLGSRSEVQKSVTSGAAVRSTFESLSSLATPPPNPPQAIRSPTVIREMAFPALSLRDGEQDTPATIVPVLKRKSAMEHISIPKKVIYGDADWRIDRHASGSYTIDEATRRLQEFRGNEGASDLYNDQRTSSTSRTQESEFTTLSSQNYAALVPDTVVSLEAYRGMVEQSFSVYTINPSPPIGTPPPASQYYEKIREYKPQTPAEETPAIVVSANRKNEQVTRGRRRRRVGS